MKYYIHFCLLATLIFGFQPQEVSAKDASETLVILPSNSTSYNFDQTTKMLTVTIVTKNQNDMALLVVEKTVTITRLPGTQLHVERLYLDSGTNIFNIYLSDLVPGTYRLKIGGTSINVGGKLKVE